MSSWQRHQTHLNNYNVSRTGRCSSSKATSLIGNIGYEIDYGAEKLIAAEKGKEKIAIELKGFTDPSDVNEFHKAVGQFNDYFVALEIIEPDRMLFLAVPEEAWFGLFQEQVIQKAIQRIQARVIVFDLHQRTISLWIK